MRRPGAVRRPAARRHAVLVPLALLAVAGLLAVSSAPGATSLLTRLTGATTPAPRTSAGISSPAVLAAAAQTGSAVTRSGTGAFAGLQVTVNQTANLVDQAVTVTWKGGAPTHSQDPGIFDGNYLQLMQCWSADTATEPARAQCEYGGKEAFEDRGGLNSAGRRVDGSSYVDPLEPKTAPQTGDDEAIVNSQRRVTFQSVDGVRVTDSANPYYDSTTSNEVPFARTLGDGTGYTTFETMTAQEAPGLGCGGALPTDPTRPVKCYLVVVPRGDSEVDGSDWSKVSLQGSHRLETSPLSQSNWRNRIVFPLTFNAAGNTCPITAKQLYTTGVETAAEAVLSWQPELCRNNGPVYGYSEVIDAVAGRTVKGSSPGLVYLNRPIDPAQVPRDRVYTYAPIALSGIAVGFYVERQTPAGAGADVKGLDGRRITDLNLTPRLVAKLLTQSYVFGAVDAGARYLKANPANITQDPDFLAVNPQFSGLHYDGSVDLLVPIGNSAAYQVIWEWIAADQEAADFLAGLPDPWGMRVNPFYQQMSTPRDDFPKTDPYCDAKAAPEPKASPLCILDAHPFAQDFHEEAQAAFRGDPLSRTRWDVSAQPPVWKKAALQRAGQRRLLAYTDTPTAARYNLSIARLRNAAGQFVAPTDASLLAALKDMKPSSVPGVLVPDPATTDKAAYPLPALTYAMTAPNKLTADAATKFADFIRYAVGPGQTRGTAAGNLPAGYTPLPSALRQQALAAARLVQARTGPRSSSGGSGKGSSGSGGSSTGGSGTGGGTGRTGGRGGTGGTGGTGPTPQPSASTPVRATPAPTAALAAASAKTPRTSVGASRYVPLIALILGIAAAVCGPLLPRLARRLGQ